MRFGVDLSRVDAVAIDGDHVAWRHPAETRGENWATALGDDAARLTALLDELDSARRLDGVTVPDSVHGLLPPRFTSPDPGHWSFWLLDDDGRDRSSAAVDLAPGDVRIDPLLAHSESAHLYSDSPRVSRWVGVEEGGELVAVAGQVTEAGDVAHIVSVCTHPDSRGRGLAGEVCNRIITEARAEGAPAVFLEMYAANEPARSAYRALGFVEVGQYRSGLLRPTP